MRKLIVSALLILYGCGAKKTAVGEKPLFEVLTQQSDGGANIRFYEILSEQNEIMMLLSDDNLRDKISADDTKMSNFIILNMGEKFSGGFSIGVESVIETPEKIIVTVQENEPKKEGMSTTVMSYPYAIVKINSKKPIEIK